MMFEDRPILSAMAKTDPPPAAQSLCDSRATC